MRSLTKTNAFIDGHWVPVEQRFAVTNPATGEVVAEVADADATLAERAVEAAKNALPGWRKKTPHERAELLRRWFNSMLSNKQALAELMCAEQGKPVAEAAAEIEYGASFVEWFAAEAERSYGDVLPLQSPDKRVWITKQGVGVCAAITPWNFPNAMITRKVAPALAAGCTMVVKPPQLTPLSALAIAQLASEVGIPDGVINIVPSTDAKSIGGVLTEHPDVRKFSFTGSTAVGKKLMQQCASTVKKVSFELGGNAPFIVFDDADIELAVEQLLICKFRNAGQTCISANRILVQEKVLDKFVNTLKSEMEKLKVAPGTADEVDYGPLIDQDAIDKVKRLVADAREQGAECLTGGKVLDEVGELFYAPTLLTGVTSTMDIAQEEIFGPVVAVQTFDTEEEGIRKANATPFGLAGYFCAEDYRRIERVSSELECGMLGINAGAISHAYNAFGGVKESGIGREGSRYGLAEYQETKTLTLGGFA
ncbi:NAD-dependent succinate-semialdehyde dehydrogenase [Pseudidiomarina sp. 1APP75-32.1]|uniref:NAD-dependent succinate-semialdehyde dehydrogenase n=2 Tax=Pseudidiomarina terrestris TaxID=2820060 RepID=A0AAW7QY54_9GAMM|nr:NAD-dependent succinate-semialdehyde dehydrogenase [Pseudidiomarina sp. 1APP75-32.1]MDN7127537.1 NAD-dependent succinate-semialdehyde dehydrogenase [Pseudidiomarina sp. 1APR75-33.1]MDN7130283.1 NAD-dependent succinate-semialdehyde dehydrogenase [Pseudidiomarina sp. 1APR75-15]MDN7136206.1 NAD-dependent succinate-semialdehyde dehydrogenase [Pseudidiomarina sp. 1ASP75-5]